MVTRVMACRRVLLAVLLCGLGGSVFAPMWPAAAAGLSGRQQLRAQDLLGGAAGAGPSSLGAFAPARGAQAAGARFEGRLRLGAAARGGGFLLHTDLHGVAAATGSPPRRLPEFAFDLLQSDGWLLPLRRGAITGDHPYWEFVLEPGRVWQEAGDQGYSRAALPFSLLEVNANCTHNGMLGFLFKSDGSVSRVAYQISSETCAYLKFDMWGMLDAGYSPHEVPGGRAAASAFATELASRLPRKPIAALARDYPGVDPANFAHPGDIAAAHLTTFGVVADGVHYSGGCPTRAGEHPFCEFLDLPSYSLAKSLFAGLALMRLERRYPGARALRVAGYVPECGAGGNWDGVSFENLLDMASGNYRSDAAQGDEASGHAERGFFLPRTHREKIDYACNFFAPRAAPGERWVYHSSDTYLLGVAMGELWRRKQGPDADLFDDVVVPELFGAMGLGPVAAVSRRTRDAAAQTFAGFGLTLQPDDVARAALFLNPAGAAAEALLDRQMLRAALQLDPHDRGLPASEDGSMRYNNGFWALRIDDLPGCEGPRWLAFMSGFGGISVVLLPNGVSYYYFSDNNEFSFRRAAREAAKIRPCRAPAADSNPIPSGKYS